MDNYHYKYCGGMFLGFTFLTTPCSEIQTDLQSANILLPCDNSSAEV